MNVCKWCTSGLATENSILLSVLPRLNKTFNQSSSQYDGLVNEHLNNIRSESEFE